MVWNPPKRPKSKRSERFDRIDKEVQELIESMSYVPPKPPSHTRPSFSKAAKAAKAAKTRAIVNPPRRSPGSIELTSGSSSSNIGPSISISDGYGIDNTDNADMVFIRRGEPNTIKPALDSDNYSNAFGETIQGDEVPLLG